jgi:hypothetical protein
VSDRADIRRVLQYLIDFANERSLEWKQDSVGNLVIKRPGSAGGECAPVVVVQVAMEWLGASWITGWQRDRNVIQGHVDMVCEKAQGVQHDFAVDGISLKRAGDWLHADGTTLGADNGIGNSSRVAMPMPWPWTGEHWQWVQHRQVLPISPVADRPWVRLELLRPWAHIAQDLQLRLMAGYCPQAALWANKGPTLTGRHLLWCCAGVAAALALLDMPPTAKLPPLECLFTVDEETGLNGAAAIDSSLVVGRTMLNLDTEVWGQICCSCAGAGDTTITLDVQLENAPSSAACFKVRLRPTLPVPIPSRRGHGRVCCELPLHHKKGSTRWCLSFRCIAPVHPARSL